MSEEVQDDGSRNSASLDESDASGAECATLDASTNISQTTISQCTMCRSPKSVVNEDIFRLQDGASALPTQEICGAEAVTERLKPLRISSPQGASASSVAKWPCPTCTYDNWPRSLKCAMCGSSNPAAPPAPPAPPAAPPAPPAHPPPAYTPHPAHPALGINDICNSQSASIHELDAGARRSKRRNNTDWIWLQACLGVVEGDARCVETYLSGGGDPARALTHAEVALLNRASAFDAGHTLVHLAIRFQRQEILSTLLSRISGGGPGLKRSPSYIAPDLASAIRRHIASTVRYKKGGFPVRYIGEFSTFYLPAEISELPAAIQEQLFSELLDREAQATLEGARPPLLNWRGSRLYALWNRSAGDCLPDALCQAAWGVADRHNTLRAALHDALQQRALYARWAAWERAQAARLQYAPSEAQLRAEWARLAAAAARPGQALHQLHVWALAHVLRRPILVYGVDVVNSFRGEALGYARFRGLYLPLLCEAEGCSKSPLSLAYTRGHFSALVPLAPRVLDERAAALPLTDPDGKLLPVHFLSADEVRPQLPLPPPKQSMPHHMFPGTVQNCQFCRCVLYIPNLQSSTRPAHLMCDPESVVRRWVCAGEWRGVLAARQALPPRPLLQAQLLEEWLNHYRRLAYVLLSVYYIARVYAAAAPAAGAAVGGVAQPTTRRLAYVLLSVYYIARVYAAAAPAAGAAVGGVAQPLPPPGRVYMPPRPLLQAQLLEEWLNHYRRLAYVLLSVYYIARVYAAAAPAAGATVGGVAQPLPPPGRVYMPPRPLLQAQLLEEWLNHYRRLAYVLLSVYYIARVYAAAAPAAGELCWRIAQPHRRWHYCSLYTI
ncbi:hypothetical protein SFRURICE_007557 [Spodoptera frugiperda]|nr:hypothetical protein SFRURICE_007557 [Spodoptera frugiperda]